MVACASSTHMVVQVMRQKELNISYFDMGVGGYESKNRSLALLRKLLVKSRVLPYVARPRFSFDLELTNACNTSCIFCPREKVAKEGFIDFNMFKKAVQRAKGSGVALNIVLSGLGEPLLHPQVVDFERFLTSEGLDYDLVTNAALLTRGLAGELVDAGPKRILFSVSGINETYETIHRLDFEVTKKNILDFIEVSNGRCEATIVIVICDENRNEIDQLIAFWRDLGISHITLIPMHNRGGAVDVDRSYRENRSLYHQAVEILKRNHISTMCWAPFVYWFVGWDGNYYLCCNEYGKKLPLGAVLDHSMKEISIMKGQLLSDDPDVCKKCDQSPVSMVMDVLFRIERAETAHSELDRITNLLRTHQDRAMFTRNEILRGN